MEFQVEQAKNGEYTLQINNIYLYSKYNPKKSARNLIQKEYSGNSKGVILVGLGLGYHLEAMLELAQKKEIIVLYLFKEELNLFMNYGNKQITEKSNVKIASIEEFVNYDINDYQIIIPNPWLKAIETKHPLFEYLEDIKIRQITFNSNQHLMYENFVHNIMNYNSTIANYKDKYSGKMSCLVSAGPSLDDNIDILKRIHENCYILCVGSALKVLLEEGIVPNAVIVTDPHINVVEQFKNINYHNDLFFLCTCNKETIDMYKGKKIIIFQEGYSLAEDYAKKNHIDLLETGGSVATTAISLLEFMGFSKIILFGQDLGFEGSNTHAKRSTSNIKVVHSINYFRKVISNSNKLINTTSNLDTYARWIERKAMSSKKIRMYNTALNGRKLQGIPYIDNEQLLELIYSEER